MPSVMPQQSPLERTAPYERENIEAPNVALGVPAFGMEDLVAVLRRRARIIVGVVGVVVLATMAYVSFETPRYAATAVIVLDSRKARPNEEIAGLSVSGADPTTADSQVELLKSESVASSVIDQLKLEADPTFFEPKTIAKRITAFASRTLRTILGSPSPETNLRNAALDILKDNLTVTRVGTTYAIEVTYQSPEAKRAAEIANAFVEAYQNRQSEAKDSQTRGTTAWLSTRLEELRQKSRTIDFEMQQLRQEGTSASTGSRTLVLLRDLERETETYKRLYQTFLSRYQQAIEQESLPIDEARVVTRARPPADPVYPRRLVFLAASVFLAAGLGLALALLMEMRERGIRTARDVRERLGVPFLGMLPRLRGGGAGGQRLDPSRVYRYVQDSPGSIYAEALKSLWIAIDTAPPHRRPKVVGICSILPNEGKSIVSSNFALTLASSDMPVLIIDADLRNPTLSRSFAPPDARRGDAIDRPESQTQTIEIAPGVDLALARPNVDRANHSHTVLPRTLLSVIENASSAYQYVVIDLPPLGMIADVPAVAPLVDHFILVVEWGRTPHRAIRSALEGNSGVFSKCLGVVINSVDFNRLRFYDQDGTVETVSSLQATYFKSSSNML